ncbi:hypothetical protein [Spartinivicinus poritis]|uniref:Uncharacterized protein n=1 Tax=Spartinivicinus poritis TaxID=2994640 RepID=A0ABT5UFE7_9GAMM|nr:hypothetical protein [Spartinivicinus sp. A2-2]MDE1465032.1 hypothetical protein [Spartinivicinus sp. A2-2]
MTNSLTIPSGPPSEPGQRFFDLKNEALQVIQRLAKDTWTDHNLQDPGITFLEALVFIINDLSYRLSFPIPDLLTPPADSGDSIKDFHPPKKILPSPAVATIDYQRLAIDIEGVRHAWVTTVHDTPQGLWDIFIIPEATLATDQFDTLREKVRNHLVAHRNVGEDFHQVMIPPQQGILLNIKVTLEKDSNEVEAMAQFYNQVLQFLLPRVKRYSSEELQVANLSGDAIYDGPWLEHGFIKADELLNIPVKQKICVSDINRILINTQGVERANHIQIALHNAQTNNIHWDNWFIDVNPSKIQTLLINETLKHLVVLKEGHVVTINRQQIEKLINRFQELVAEEAKPIKTTIEDIPSGRDRNLRFYLSIQQDLPAIYRITPACPTPQDTNRYLQSGAFLLLFDQVLANQFAQLENIHRLLTIPNVIKYYDVINRIFSIMMSSDTLSYKDVEDFWEAVKQLPATHQSQPVKGHNQITTLLNDYYTQYLTQQFNLITEQPFSSTQINRIKRAYEHLLALFNEQIPNSATLQYPFIFKPYLNKLLAYAALPQSVNPKDPDRLLNQLMQLKTVVDHAYFLKNYPTISRDRSLGVDYLATPSQPQQRNASGLKLRLYHLLGITCHQQWDLATHNREGFHILEGLLLRYRDQVDPDPITELDNSKLYFIFPDWPTRFTSAEFKALIVRTVYSETPTHLQPMCIWLNRKQMDHFEHLFNAWLQSLSHLALNKNE